jgi:hypothetical protein
MTPWPTPAEAADTAAESVRALNHATLSGTGYEWPSDVGAVLNALTVLAQRLPQALDQAGRWLEREHNAGRVGHDHGDALTFDAVDQALTCLDDARTAADALAAALGLAAGHVSHLTGRTS